MFLSLEKEWNNCCIWKDNTKAQMISFEWSWTDEEEEDDGGLGGKMERGVRLCWARTPPLDRVSGSLLLLLYCHNQHHRGRSSWSKNPSTVLLDQVNGSDFASMRRIRVGRRMNSQSSNDREIVKVMYRVFFLLGLPYYGKPRLGESTLA